MSPLDYQLQEDKAHACLVHHHTTLVFADAHVLFPTLHLTRQRGQFCLQNSSQLGFNIPILLLSLKPSWSSASRLGGESTNWYPCFQPILMPFSPWHCCHSDLPKLQARMASHPACRLPIHHKLGNQVCIPFPSYIVLSLPLVLLSCCSPADLCACKTQRYHQASREEQESDFALLWGSVCVTLELQ